jgi:hypothetical protein
MAGSALFLDYTGTVDYKTIDRLLNDLKKSEDFLHLDRTTGKRLYGILVECLENIIRHSAKDSSIDLRFKPFILAQEFNNNLTVKSGNTVHKDQIVKLARELNRVNQTDDKNLTSLYDEIISKKTLKPDNGAGLGLIMIKLKSGNNIDYSFTGINENFSFFEINILINKYIMRKLIFEKTESSPKVILDPEKKIFEISGESRPADVGTFYGEILRWVDDYSLHLLKNQDSTDPVVFNFDLEYFNSSSAKYILDFCKQVASVRSKGRKIEVRWKYEEDDIDMLEAGREMSRIAKLPFEYIKKEN